MDITATGHEAWFDAYRHDIPVVHLNGREIFRHRVDQRRLIEILKAASVPNSTGNPQARRHA